MRETTKQNLAIISITILIVASVFIFINFIKPAVSQREELIIKIKETEEKIKILEEYKAKFNQLVQSYQNSGDQIEMINQALPNEAQTAQVLSNLDAISKKTGISLSGLNFTTQVQDNYNILSVTTDFTTSYDNFKLWLSELEKELRLTDLNKITIKAASLSTIPGKKAASSNPTLQFNVDFVMYYQS